MLGIRKDFICECHRFRTGAVEISCYFGSELLTRVTQWSEDVVPTVAFNFRKVKKGNVTMKIWDVAGIPLTTI